jgi:Sel1 repeat
MSVLPFTKWERSITRMKLVTVFALAITALAMFARYSHTDTTGRPHHDTSPISVAKDDMAIPRPPPQQILQEQNPPRQSNIANSQPTDLENVLSASREQVISALQEPVQGTDLNRTLNKAKAGDSTAQYQMALRYADGEGVLQSFQDAMAWFAQAASAGKSNAQWKLGLGYLKGIGVPQDDGKAIMWLKRAANNGHTPAQNALSDLYFSGRGVPLDYVRAYTWANIAAGLQGANSDRLDAIRRRMTRTQIQDAEQRTSIWRDYARQRAAGSSSSQRFGVSGSIERHTNQKRPNK